MKDIQKLAAEMGLKCITTYKLDALKAVRRGNECDDTINQACSTNDNDITLQSSLQEEENASISSEGMDADENYKKSGM